MTIDRILFLVAAICWFIGAMRAFFGNSPDTNSSIGRIDWWLMGAAFVALTFVF